MSFSSNGKNNNSYFPTSVVAKQFLHAGDDLVLEPAQESGQDEEPMVGIFSLQFLMMVMMLLIIIWMRCS